MWVFGWNDLGARVLVDLDRYMPAGSSITVAVTPDLAPLTAGVPTDLTNATVAVRVAGGPEHAAVVRNCATRCDHALVLCDVSDGTGDSDPRALLTTMELREALRTCGRTVNVVTEVRDERDVDLIPRTTAADFIVSERLASLLLAQVSEHADLAAVYDDLLHPDGSELYCKPAARYVEPGREVSFADIVDRGRRPPRGRHRVPPHRRRHRSPLRRRHQPPEGRARRARRGRPGRGVGGERVERPGSLAMDAVAGTLVGRWYVTLFGLTFAWCAVRHLGWRRTLVYTVAAVAVGGLAENGSVHLGVPYTRYAFNPDLRGDELFLGDVPLMVPLSYTFMAYFAFAAGRLVASGPYRTRALRPWHEWLVAIVLAVWALWILDPVSRLGDEFYLGRLFEYAGPGFWFGLPLGSQLGFAATAAVLLAILAVLDRAAPDQPVAGLRRHPHLVALVTYHAQVFHLAVVALVIGAHTIGGSAFLMWIPAVAVGAVHWSTLRLRERRRR